MKIRRWNAERVANYRILNFFYLRIIVQDLKIDNYWPCSKANA